MLSFDLMCSVALLAVISIQLEKLISRVIEDDAVQLGLPSLTSEILLLHHREDSGHIV